MNKPKKFSVKHAFIGFWSGAFVPFIFLVHHIYNAPPAFAPENAEQAYFSPAGYIIMLICAVAGLFWRGFESTRNRFALSMSVAGTFLGNLLCVFFMYLLNLILSDFNTEYISYFAFHAFMLAGFFFTGYLLRGKIPAFDKDAHDEWRRPGT